ncbi:ultraviolet N-glycosylase/AP lyase [bacterium BMS3Abin03]|nr:ultraviolet N-glycosylase/AP lyase [bacterium BMS3Abin03]
MKQQIKKINRLLVDHYGVPKRNKKLPDPVDMLIGTILSQNTNDKNSYKAFSNLKAKYYRWEEVAKLPLSKIEKIIKVAGLGKQKSKAIKKVLSNLLKQNGKISLNHFKKLDDAAIMQQLTGYNGVGIKTASCVLLFSLDRNVCPVDTHVQRTLNRIGLVKTASPEKTFYEINGNIPEGIAHSFHTNLIRLGREICKPSKPNCKICPLFEYCTFAEKNLASVVSVKKNDFMLLDNIN